jgi:hypothetical protein
MSVVFSNAYFTVESEEGSRIVRCTRTAEPFTSPAEILRGHEEVARALDRFGRAGAALLVDVRNARGLHDPALEGPMAEGRMRVMEGFARAAVLVKTAAGALQVQRHAREDGVDLRTFQNDEDGALAYLAAPSTQRISYVPQTGPLAVVPRAPEPRGKVGR